METMSLRTWLIGWFLFSRLKAVRAIVEHPFQVVKRQFGFMKVRYHGLAKNTGQIVTLFALTNLWLARKRLLP